VGCRILTGVTTALGCRILTGVTAALGCRILTGFTTALLVVASSNGDSSRTNFVGEILFEPEEVFGFDGLDF